MNPMDVGPTPKRRRISPAFLVWLAGVGTIVLLEWLDRILERFDRDLGILGVFSFFAWLLVIGLTLYGFAVMVRWVLRQLFWTVGRRLFLSYLLIGVLPFILMTILLLTIVYMFAAVMTQAALRGERQATLGQMESWALEYAMTGRRISGGLPSLELYDTVMPSGEKLPEWLRSRSFSGVVERDGKPLLVAARQFPLEEGETRGIVLVQPLDKHWTDALYDKSRMIVRTARAEAKTDSGNIDIDTDEQFRGIFSGNVGTKIIWGDLAEITDWQTGKAQPTTRSSR
jgi:hypothetical protein